jgi:hypothetical protein
VEVKVSQRIKGGVHTPISGNFTVDVNEDYLSKEQPLAGIIAIKE